LQYIGIYNYDRRNYWNFQLEGVFLLDIAI